MDCESYPGVFICGRQHSGNTMLAHLIGRMDGGVMAEGEAIVLEHRERLDALPSASERVEWIGRHLALKHPEFREALLEHLRRRALKHPQADCITIWHYAISLATRCAGGTFWVRKATSYIFQAETILRRIPNVKMVYLMRNPLDVCASRKRREPRGEYIVGWALSWNRGAQLAARCKDQYPDRFHIIRYEELTAHPERVVRALCEFLGQTYAPELLDVPVINTAEDQFRVVDGARGIQSSRTNRYLELLDETEIVAMRMLCSRSLLCKWYPELGELSRQCSVMTEFKAMALIASGAVRFPFQMLRRAARNEMPLRHYVLRRWRVLMGGTLRESAGEVASGNETDELGERLSFLRLALAGLIAVVLGVIVGLTHFGSHASLVVTSAQSLMHQR